MADYYPLLSRAIVNLGESAGPDVRRAIYDRARTTLRSQLEEIDPPLPQDQIERERAQLEAVIARLEMEARARSRPVTKLPLRYQKSAQAQGHGDNHAEDGEVPSDSVQPVPEAPHEGDDGLHHEGAAAGSHTSAEEPHAPRFPEGKRPWFADWRV